MLMSACNGQTSNKKINPDLFQEQILNGDTVKELGNNLMDNLSRQKE